MSICAQLHTHIYIYTMCIYESWDAKARVGGFGPNCYCSEGAAALFVRQPV